MPNTSPAWAHLTAGTKTNLLVPVVRRAAGDWIELPVTVVCGTRPGKTLLVFAGIHGDEFEGMAALRTVCDTAEPEQLAGTLVAVMRANPPAFEAGLRTNPDDRQDLARVFPGDVGGTVTEQLAHTLTHGFIRHADLLCDLHSAGQYYNMPPLAGYKLCDEPNLGMQRRAAKAFGLPLVWGTPGYPGRTLTAASDFGVPAVYVETTGEGRCRPADVEQYAYGIRQLMALLEMTSEPPAEHTPEWLIEDARPGAGFLQVQNRAPVGGLFNAGVAVWDRVECGQPIGEIRDAFGTVLHTITASHAGRVVFLRTFCRLLAGDPVCNILAMDD